MSSVTDAYQGSNGICRLEDAFRSVLGEDFDAAIRQLVEAERWYAEVGDISEVFRLWVCDNIHSPGDPQWIFQPIRATERKFLCDALGIDRTKIVGVSPRTLANRLMTVVGLPCETARGWLGISEDWQKLVPWIEQGEDDKAAAVARQLGERVLKLLLYFYCHAGAAQSFLRLLKDPGSLRVPRVLAKLADESLDVKMLLEQLAKDDWADLGFLSLALRKLSLRLVEDRCDLSFLSNTEIFGQDHADSFLAMCTALQPFAHDKPASATKRSAELYAAVQRVIHVLEDLKARNTLPDQLIVLETCGSVVGPVFRGINERKDIRHFAAMKLPELGKKIWYVANAKRDFARCIWSPVPW